MQNSKLISIYNKAKNVFYHENSQDIEQLKQILYQLTPEDFNLSQKMCSIQHCNNYIAEDIFTGENFHMGLFMIPQGQELALHDHPQMKVFMRVMWGEMYIKAYDWATEYPWSGLARMTTNKEINVFSEIETIEPHHANIHYIKAISDCAFIDLFSPHYSEEEGRSCTYYQEVENVQTKTGEKLTRLQKK